MNQRLLQLVIKQAAVRGKPYFLLVILAAAANDAGEVRLTKKELCKRLRSSDEGGLYAAVAELVLMGYVQRWGRPGTRGSYFVVSERGLRHPHLMAIAKSNLPIITQRSLVEQQKRLWRANSRPMRYGSRALFTGKDRKKLL